MNSAELDNTIMIMRDLKQDYEAEVERLRGELAEEKELRRAEFKGYHLAVKVTEAQYEAKIIELQKENNWLQARIAALEKLEGACKKVWRDRSCLPTEIYDTLKLE